MTNKELRALLLCFPDDMPINTWLPIPGSQNWDLCEIENAFIEPFGEDCIILSGIKDDK